MTQPSIADTLLSIRDGGTMEDLGDQLRTLCKRVQLSGKAGKLSLELAIKPNGSRAVQIVDSIKVVEPKVENEASFFFVTDDGGLTRNDPLQPQFDQLKEVGK